MATQHRCCGVWVLVAAGVVAEGCNAILDNPSPYLVPAAAGSGGQAPLSEAAGLAGNGWSRGDAGAGIGMAGRTYVSMPSKTEMGARSGIESASVDVAGTTGIGASGAGGGPLQLGSGGWVTPGEVGGTGGIAGGSDRGGQSGAGGTALTCPAASSQLGQSGAAGAEDPSAAAVACAKATGQYADDDEHCYRVTDNEPSTIECGRYGLGFVCDRRTTTTSGLPRVCICGYNSAWSQLRWSCLYYPMTNGAAGAAGAPNAAGLVNSAGAAGAVNAAGLVNEAGAVNATIVVSAAGAAVAG